MAIPDFQTLMRPVLGLVLDKPKHYTACAAELVPVFNLTQEEVEELVGSGVRTTFVDRVYWTTVHMKGAGVIERPSRGYVLATDRGRSLYQAHPERIDTEVLEQFPEYIEFRQRSTPRATRARASVEEPGDTATEAIAESETRQSTPRERIAIAYTELNSDLRTDLLESIRLSSPAFFERLILALVVALGYGSKEQAEHLGGPGDHGIDGLVNQDSLGLDKIYLQAKRYTGHSVGEEDIRNFVGSLEAKGATKGVFVTASSFAPSVHRFMESSRSAKQIRLIDGEELTRLLVEYNVGVVPDGEPLVVKKIDENYFSE